MNSKKRIFRKNPTKKQTSRLNNNRGRKNNKDLYNSFLLEYSNLNDDELIELSNRLLISLDIENNELRYNSLIDIMQSKLIGKYSYNSKFSGYPDYEDDDFNSKISNKKEFYINKIPKREILTNSENENMSKKLCDPLYGNPKKEEIIFKLTENQKFLKSFMGPNTPYNSMLLYHGTGVGKTCTSISIAEQYSDELKKLNKKIIILLNPSIKTNFIKNIFNIQKIKQGIPYYQCTGDKYLTELDIENMDNINYSLLESKMNKIIKGRYEFYGYQKFGNIIENLQQKIRDKYPQKDHLRLIKKKIKDTFSNTVFIIDEVHNIKESNSLKVLPPLLNKVVSYAENMKLLLLSATPMFDTSNEIFFLLNLMLKNDDRPIMYAKEYMDKNGNLIQKMKSKFIRNIRGYISYMRGEDPYRFPLRLYPSPRNIIPIKNMPTIDSDGKPINDALRIKDLKIVGCTMNGYQLSVYEKMESTKEKYGAFEQPAIMCSNIVFPKKDVNNVMNPTYTLDNFISNNGFNNIMNKKKINGSIKYSIKHEEFKDFYKLKNLKNYSTKISSIIENIDKRDGIIFIYSQFLNSGLIPLALALEYMGFSKYDNSLITDKIPNKGKYIIISGDSDLSNNAYSDYLKIQNENKNGDKIKIILGSETAAEGLDFSYIREVHILDPWFHLNKIEQVIGRGIRNCSHIDLDSKDRNVTIYLYAAIKPLTERVLIETVDLEIYRKAELKSKQMSEIEYILKTNSVDCYLNLNGNKFENDDDYSKKCNYKKCDYKCNYNVDDTNLNYNTIALDESIIKDNINDIKQKIVQLYKVNYYYSINDFSSILNVDKLLLYFALNELISNNTKLIDKYKNYGYLIYKNNYYIFVKKNSSKFISLNNIRKSSKKRINTFNISRKNILNSISKYNKLESNSSNSIMEKGAIIISNYETNNNILDYLVKLKLDSKLILDMVSKINNYYLDNMLIDDKKNLLHYLIIKNNSNTLTKLENTIYNSMYNILFYKRDVYFNDITYKGDENIWGYKIINKKKLEYYKFDNENNTFSKASDLEVKQIQKSFKKKNINIPTSANIIGYYEVKLPQNTIVFKIRDKTLEGKKGSQIKTGSICDNDGMKKTKVITFIENILETKIYIGKEKIPNKKLLCKYLEFLLRYYNITKDDYRYFFGPEETIEYKLNEK